MSTTIEGKAILVTGANGGIGQALVTEALRRGAARVYAGTRQPYAHPDPRVTSLALDITHEGQVRAAAAQVEVLCRKFQSVVNPGDPPAERFLRRTDLENGMVRLNVQLLPEEAAVVEKAIEAAIRLASGGAIVNNVSIAALAPIPVTPAYSLSKAAAFSLTQSLRMLLAGQGVRVHAVLTGPVDTDMVRDLDIPKASPQSVAQGIFDGVGKGEEDIFPDPLSATLADGWQAGSAKALERQNAALLQSQPVAS